MYCDEEMKQKLEGEVSVMRIISDKEMTQSVRDRGEKKIDVTSPDFRSGYAMAYSMAIMRIEDTLKGSVNDS